MQSEGRTAEQFPELSCLNFLANERAHVILTFWNSDFIPTYIKWRCKIKLHQRFRRMINIEKANNSVIYLPSCRISSDYDCTKLQSTNYCTLRKLVFLLRFEKKKIRRPENLMFKLAIFPPFS